MVVFIRLGGYVKIVLIILLMSLSHFCYSGDPGFSRENYIRAENLKKSKMIDFNKIEEFSFETNFYKLNKKEIENKIPYAFSKKMILKQDSEILSYVAVLKVFAKPTSVQFVYSNSKLKLVTLYLGTCDQLSHFFELLKPIYGKNFIENNQSNPKYILWKADGEVKLEAFDGLSDYTALTIKK